MEDGVITEYLGNYSYYKEKLKQEEDLLALANEGQDDNGTSGKTIVKSNDSINSTSYASANKNGATTESNAGDAEVAPKKQNSYMTEKMLAETESEIARLEATMKMYEVQLANPVVQQDVEELAKLSQQMEQAQQNLDELYEKWERLAAE